MLDDDECVFENRPVVFAKFVDFVRQRELPTRFLNLDLALVGVRPGVYFGFERRAAARVVEGVLGCRNPLRRSVGSVIRKHLHFDPFEQLRRQERDALTEQVLCVDPGGLGDDRLRRFDDDLERVPLGRRPVPVVGL